MAKLSYGGHNASRGDASLYPYSTSVYVYMIYIPNCYLRYRSFHSTMIFGIVPVTIVCTLLALWVSKRLSWKARPPYPPGPPAEPILGHLRAVPSSYDEGVYREMGDKYGMLRCLLSSEVCISWP